MATRRTVLTTSAAAVLTGFAPTQGWAASGKRLALIVANAQYKPPLDKLPGTQLDAELVAASLQALGFDVTVTRNLDYRAMRRALSTFYRQVSTAGNSALSFLYYSGHGAADGAGSAADNYLLPIDAEIQNVSDLPVGGWSLSRELDAIAKTNARASIVVVDACRNTPVGRQRGPSKGLVPVPVRKQSIVGFSATPGETAADDSVYARVLSEELLKPEDIATVFDNVRYRVLHETRQKQAPKDDNNLIEKLFLRTGPIKVGPTPPVKPLPAPALRDDRPGVVDFNKAPTQKAMGSFKIVANEFLQRGTPSISVRDLKPVGSRLVIVHNAGIYEGRAVTPNVSENFLSQENTGNKPASYVLTLKEPVRSFAFTIPQVYPESVNGITFPAWRVVALSEAGGELSSHQEALRRRFRVIPSETFTLSAPAFDLIKAVRIESDPNLNGVPFAAFSTVLIEQIRLVRDA